MNLRLKNDISETSQLRVFAHTPISGGFSEMEKFKRVWVPFKRPCL